MTSSRRMSLTITAVSVGFLLQATPALAQSGGRRRAQPRKEQVDLCKLQEGDKAPDFDLTDPAGENGVKLSELRGKPVFLVFGSYT